MNKNSAKDILLAYACCSFANITNQLCISCPWNNTQDCKNTKFNEELIVKAVDNMKGNKAMKIIKLSEIKIKKTFEESNPNPEKMQRYQMEYIVNRKQSKPILIDRNNVLLDGYIQYLILKENNIEEAEVIRTRKHKSNKKKKNYSYKNETTTYIYGIHPNNKHEKEYVWRVPQSWLNWDANLQVNDMIFCSTKFGSSPVIITKIEKLDRPPVNIPIKKVYNQKIIRN